RPALAAGAESGNPVEGQLLNRAQRKRVRDVESGRTLFGAEAPRILRRSLQHRAARPGEESAQHRAGIVQRSAESVAGLESQPGAQRTLPHRGLKRVISR